MRVIIFIGIGSFIGGVARYLLSQLIQPKAFPSFPYGTLAVNIIGCFLIGIIYGLAQRSGISNEWRLFLMTGILGGFTTFSAFSLETITLMRSGHTHEAFLYVAVSIIIGLLATWSGMLAGGITR